jgi:hypothetical protein
MTGLTHIHQCPRCELKFTSTSELEDHLSNDHRPRRPVEIKPAPVIVAPVAPPPAIPDSNTGDIADGAGEPKRRRLSSLRFLHRRRPS